MPDKRSDSNGLQSKKPPSKSGLSLGAQTALAMELPFTLVGTVVVGGLIGYLLDKWLHTSPWLLLLLGAIGFFGGVREVLRRVPDGSSGK
jgi:ATP synthase protein I